MSAGMHAGMHPAPVDFAPSLGCPACGRGLVEDRDGTSCDRCGGLLVGRGWAERCLPDRGPPALPPVFSSSSRVLACPGCRKDMVPVLCHGVAAFSCARCRLLFFDGPKRKELVEPGTRAPPPKRALAHASLLHVVAERAAPVSLRLFGALAFVAVVALAAAGGFVAFTR